MYQPKVQVSGMNTPTSSQIASSSRAGSLQSMLLELDRKIGEISDLKDQITQRMSIQEQQSAQKELFTRNHSKEALLQKQIKDLAETYQKQFAGSIRQEILAYGNEQMQLTIQIAKQYQKQSNMMKKYYEQETNELKLEIQRQYKVMARMKQQVEDLVVLMKYKENAEMSENQKNEQDEEDSQMNEEKRNNFRLSGIGNRDLHSELDVIQEETERTLQSSERSMTTQSQLKQQSINYIRIQQKLSQDGSNSKPYLGSQLNDEVQDFQKCAQSVQQFPEAIEKNDCYKDFCEDLTPKQSEKADELPSQFHSSANNDESQIYLNSSESNSEIKYRILPNKGRKELANASFTNQSKRNDHHESIFFLDEEPQYLNKTTELKNIDRSKSSEYLKSVRNQSKKSNDSFLFFKERNEGCITEEEISRFGSEDNENRKACDGSFFTDHANDYSSVKMQYYLEGYETLKNKIQKQQSENSHKSQGVSNQAKMKKKINYFNNQETSEEIFSKFSKVIPEGDIRNSSSVPFENSGQPLGQLYPNLFEKNVRSSIENKPKTKQFLDEFRRTFNKCLNSMQASKKNSTKIINSSAKQKSKANDEGSRPLGVMTFGKNISSQRTYSHSPLSKDIKDKENLNFGTKRQDGSRFMTGNRKMEVKYEGDKKNGVREGNGVLFYSNGLCYEGQFKNGLRHGFGVLKINHIDIYNGDWINDEIEGSGKIRNCAIINKRKTVNSNQGTLGKWISYHGEFKDSAFDGEGTLCLQGGERYVGNFRNGCAFGEGTLFRKNGEVERGTWQNGVVTIGQ